MALDPETTKLLHESFEFRPPLGAEGVARLRERFGYAIPDDYFEFLAASNGGEGPVGESGYVQLWPAESWEEQSRDYDPEQVVPHLLMFGTDLGGTVYAFDRRDNDRRILALPLPVEEEYAEVRGHSFKNFLKAEGDPGGGA